ncbi:MAG: hypothetical protein R3246_15925 [Acidimicrobiia bacterium]|nr:hypothetical protein [Acidimicrobiia bacterium]
MTSTVPDLIRLDARPPIEMDAAPPPGTVDGLRPTVYRRPVIRPHPWHDAVSILGYEVDDPYVRRYWTAVIGPAAVADLLRLTVAAQRSAAVVRPIRLGMLVREGLVKVENSTVRVRTTVPPLSVAHVRRLPPALRSEHSRVRWESGT